MFGLFENYLLDDRLFRVHTWPGMPETKRHFSAGKTQHDKARFYAKQRRKANKKKS